VELASSAAGCIFRLILPISIGTAEETPLESPPGTNAEVLLIQERSRSGR
jgi:hypothetical protein